MQYSQIKDGAKSPANSHDHGMSVRNLNNPDYHISTFTVPSLVGRVNRLE